MIIYSDWALAPEIFLGPSTATLATDAVLPPSEAVDIFFENNATTRLDPPEELLPFLSGPPKPMPSRAVPAALQGAIRFTHFPAHADDTLEQSLKSGTGGEIEDSKSLSEEVSGLFDILRANYALARHPGVPAAVANFSAAFEKLAEMARGGRLTAPERRHLTLQMTVVPTAFGGVQKATGIRSLILPKMTEAEGEALTEKWVEVIVNDRVWAEDRLNIFEMQPHFMTPAQLHALYLFGRQSSRMSQATMHHFLRDFLEEDKKDFFYALEEAFYQGNEEKTFFAPLLFLLKREEQEAFADRAEAKLKGEKEEAMVKCRAINALAFFFRLEKGETPAKPRVTAIVDALEDTDERVGKYALQTLRSNSDHLGLNHLLDLLQRIKPRLSSENIKIRWAALDAMIEWIGCLRGKGKEEEAKKWTVVILTFRSHPNVALRKRIFKALTEEVNLALNVDEGGGDGERLRYIREFCKDSDPEIQELAKGFVSYYDEPGT